MTKRLEYTFILVLTTLLATACNSGGDDAVPALTGDDPIPPAELATIDEDSAPLVAGVAARQMLEESIVSNLTDTGVPILSAGGAATQQMLSLSGPDLPPGLAAAQATTFPCEVDGTIDLSVTVADPGAVSVNDSYTTIFDNCDNGVGSVLHGGIVMTVMDVDGDPNTERFYLRLALELDAFSVTTEGETSGASGTADIEIDTRQLPVTTVTVSASALTVTSGGVTQTLTDMTITVVEDQGLFPPALSVDSAFTLSTPELNGDIRATTIVTLQRSGENFPYDGAIEVSGDGDASVTLIALGPDAVRLEVDVDGDGAVDATIDTTWTAILAPAE